MSSFTFITHQGLPPEYSRMCLTPWSVFQDGSDKTISSTSWSESGHGEADLEPAQCTEAPCTRPKVHTRTRLRPSHAFLSQGMSSFGDLPTPAEVVPNVKVFLEPELTLTLEARNTAHVQVKTHCHACAETASHSLSEPRSRQENWFHSLPFQRFQALLTLFSKSFSPFPHGTCLLSVSSPYLALGEIYHPLCAQVPMNATRRKRTVRAELLMTDGTLTLSDALFQETYISVHTGSTSKDYNSRPMAPIFMLSSSLFIRHY